MVEVGLTPPDVTNTLPSTMNRFLTSCDRPHSFHHRTLGVHAHACRPEQMPAAIQDRTIDANVGGASGRKNLLGPRDAVFDHSRTVLADRVVDTRRRDAV